MSWTHALRTIVQDCYKHHGRDDLLPEFNDSEPCQQVQGGPGVAFPHHTMVQTINNPDGTVSIIQIDTGETGVPQVVTLADGTQAHIVHTVSDSQNFDFCCHTQETFIYILLAFSRNVMQHAKSRLFEEIEQLDIITYSYRGHP